MNDDDIPNIFPIFRLSAHYVCLKDISGITMWVNLYIVSCVQESEKSAIIRLADGTTIAVNGEDKYKLINELNLLRDKLLAEIG